MITKEPRQVTVHELTLCGDGLIESEEGPAVELRIDCSKGTYIRSLAEDIGSELGCGAYLSRLRRLRSGCFEVEGSIPGSFLDDPNKAEWVRNQLIGLEALDKLLQSR